MQSSNGSMPQAIKSIQNFMFFVRAKKNREKNKQLYRIALSQEVSLTPYTITLEHSNHQQERPMAYSFNNKEYFIELWLLPNTEFIIKSRQQKILHPQFPAKLNSSKELINFIQNTKKPINEHPAKETEGIHIFFSNFLPSSRTLEFQSSSKTLGKLADRNEDAHFFTSNSIGIADGVGGLYEEYGISSREFATELMHRCKDILNCAKSRVSCKETVQEALKFMDNGGCSTYLLANLCRNKLKVSNLGDCGMLLFRFVGSSVKLVFQTWAMQYSINTPFQLSKGFSPKQLKVLCSSNKNKKNIQDSPNIDSDEYCITVHQGDLIVAGSDGLFDNVFTDECEEQRAKDH